MATYWKREAIEMEQERLTLSEKMHRTAGTLGYSGIPKLSSIDKRWFMEVNQHVTDAAGSYLHSRFNVALGTGDTPLEAAADGYAQATPAMHQYPILAKLEALGPLLMRRVRALKQLDLALEDLTQITRSFNVPRAAEPGEDDDL